MSPLAKQIVRDAEICGGEPRIHGTRITIRAIIEAIRLAHGKEPLLEAFPDLCSEDLDAALVYYAEHPEEIDSYIKAHAMAEEDTTGVPGVLTLPPSR